MSFTIDILACLICIYTIILARRNRTLDQIKSKYFIQASILTIVILILECMTVQFEGSKNSSIVELYKITNAFGFSLTPLVVIWLSLLYWSKLEKYKKIIFVPFIINAIISFASIKTGWIFSVSVDNEYTRGPYFYEQTICSTIYFTVLLYCSFKELNTYDKEEKYFLGMIFSLVGFGVIMQIIYPSFLFIWGSVAVSILLYYVFLRELQFRYDPMTQVYNRAVFEKDMNFLTNSQNVTIIVMDINNLKKINDSYGHLVGDYMISQAAKLIAEALICSGKIYRIGGDEFCILIQNCNWSEIKKRLEIFKELVDKYNDKPEYGFLIEIAYGVSKYSKGNNANVYEAFTEADNNMYKCKKIMKNKKILKEC